MIWTGNLILRTMLLEMFNNSLSEFRCISKVICVIFGVKFGFYPDTKNSAENGYFLQFQGGFGSP